MSIIVTGGSGLVGKNLKNILKDAIYLTSKDYNLTDEQEVIKMYKEHKPRRVIHLAAKVGGILDNIANPAPYFTENILMNTFLVKHAHENNVERFTGILSTCIYPDIVETYPLTEDMLHLGPPAQTNFSYGYAKRCLAVQIDMYNKQYKTKYNYLTPCNLYGYGDKHEVTKSHFVTSLIKKINDAKNSGQNHIELLGDGSPLRQFMHVDNLCDVINFMIQNDITESFNVATEENLSIKEIANIALKACGALHLEIKWNTSMPNGQFRKDVSIEKLKRIYPDFNNYTLEYGVKKTYDQISKRHN